MHEDSVYYRHRLSKSDDKLLDSIRNASYKCKRCGRTVVINKQDRALCPDCGHWVYKSDELEFKYKIKEAMIKNGK
jgi:rRNA maturation endonuclease Nob1